MRFKRNAKKSGAHAKRPLERSAYRDKLALYAAVYFKIQFPFHLVAGIKARRPRAIRTGVVERRSRFLNNCFNEFKAPFRTNHPRALNLLAKKLNNKIN